MDGDYYNAIVVGDLNKIAMDRVEFLESKYKLVRVTPESQPTQQR
jgi:hypothetical protein